MSRNKRTLAGFDDVAKTNNDINVNTNTNNNTDINNSGGVLDAILGDKKEKQMRGIYFDPDLLEVLDRVAGDKRGAKSAIVNEALRQLFQEKGLI